MGCQDETGDESLCRGHLSEFKVQEALCKRTFNNLNTSRLSNGIATEIRGFENNKINSDNALQEKEKATKRSKLWLYRGNEIDLNRFLRFHPGGTSTIKECRGEELGPSMRSFHHSSEAYYLLRDFYNGNAEEDVVDWTKPMLGQVGRLGPLYSSWVWSPVDRPLRLFQYDWAETLTRTDWKQVIGVWVPIITIASALSFLFAPSHLSIFFRCMGVLLSIVCGMGVWPLLEYSIHRWLFHMQPPKSSPLLITLHFGLHGLHHKVPFDEGRLLFPPGPCSIMALALYQIYTWLFPWWIAMAFFSGTMLGYLIYDLIHYYLHHGNPQEGSYLYYMKRYHNQHHFAQQEIGFGISSNFWDRVFNTLIKLKKLTKPLSWES